MSPKAVVAGAVRPTVTNPPVLAAGRGSMQYATSWDAKPTDRWKVMALALLGVPARVARVREERETMRDVRDMGNLGFLRLNAAGVGCPGSGHTAAACVSSWGRGGPHGPACSTRKRTRQ